MANEEGDSQLPPDDQTIQDNVKLWRRIHPTHVVPDGSGGKRVSSAAFTNSWDGSYMSVVIDEKGVTAERVLGPNIDHGLVTFTAATARALNQRIIRKPEGHEPLHGEVCGKKSKAIQNQFVKLCQWVYVPV